MTDKNLDWKADETLPTGKGATKQRFAANGGKEELVIETAPWGEGDLTADGAEIAHVEGDMDGPDAFRELERVAKEYLITPSGPYSATNS